MKKFLLAGLIVGLGVSAWLGYRSWRAALAESSVVAGHSSLGPFAGTNPIAAAAMGTRGGQPAPAAMPVVTNVTPANVSSTTPDTVGGPPRKRAWDYNYFASLTNTGSGAPIQFELVDGNFATGTIQHAEHTNGSLILVSGDVTTPEAGQFSFRKQTLPGKAGDYSGEIIFPASKRAFRIEPTGPARKSELVERRLDEVICMTMPPIDAALDDTNAPEEMPPLRPDQVTDYIPAYNDGIISLQSLPGAIGVLYMDFRGGYTPTWGGITYAKPSVTSAQIKDVWKRVAEDYMPFNINVTTDIKIYQAAPENSRQRCVLTPTTTAAPGAGGVAYLRDWNNTGDRPCWSFYSTGKNAAEVVSHEVGHTLWLSHDGRTTPSEAYFLGQAGTTSSNGWAPIMGAGYYQPVVQWSKGEYANANNTEDDLNMIVSDNNNVDYRTDDTGATLATARYLEVYSNFTAAAEGVIETTGDTDAFRFTTAGGAISLAANPVGDWANLAIMATLADATDTIIASNNPQTVLSASIATNLPAGTYTFRVTGTGRNDPLSNGFSSYDSLGYYSITGTVAAATLTTRFTIAENSTNGQIVGVITATNLGVDALNYFIISGNASNTFALDDNGVLTVTNAAALDYEALARNTQFPVQFEMFVNITNTATPELTELNRRVLVLITNVNEAPFLSGFTNNIIAHTPAGIAVGAVQTSDPDAYTVLTLSFLGGNSNGMFTFDGAGNLLVAGDPDPATQSVYNLTIQVADNGSPILKATNFIQITVVTNTSPFRPGSISYAVYDGVGSGSLVSDLTNNAKFPRDPNWEKQISTAEGESDRADSYGSVMRGYLIVPVSGNYNFFIASDDNGEVWMSTTTNPASMTRIADITGSGNYADDRQWNKFASQKSAARALVAGQAYYIEARQKDASGGDNFAVGWAGPATGGLTNVIPAAYLSPYFLNYVPHLTGFTKTVHRDAIAGARLGQMTMTDVNANDGHSFALLSGNAAGIFGVDSNGWIYVASDTALTASATTNFTLSVRTTDSGTPALSATNTVSLTRVEAAVIVATQPQREMFNNIGSGTLVSDLTNNARFPGQPDALAALTNFASAADVADNYGSRIRALLVPSVSGNYQFFIASDDSSLLKFSRDTNAANATAIASVSGYTSQNVWSTYASQTSALITNLVAGQRYYLEALQKEGGGGDHVSVAWLVPGSGVTNIVPVANLQPVDLDYPPQFASQAFGVMQSAANGKLVGNVLASDSALDALTFKFVSGNTNNTFALDASTGVLSVTNNTVITNGTVPNFTLTVVVQDSGYGGLYPLRSSTNLVIVSVISTNGLVWDASTNFFGAQDGNGNWGTAPTNWWNGFTNSIWTNNLVALFGSGTTTNCTVTIANDVTPAGIVFNPNSGGIYTLASGAGGLNLSGRLQITANADAIISASIKGAGYVKNGVGTLTLSGANTSTGGVTVQAGTLKLTNSVAAFGTGPVTNNAVIEWSTAAGSRVIGSINSFAGAGLFLKSGANNLQLQGANVSTFNGTVRVVGGMLILDTATGFEDGVPDLDLTGGDLVLGGAFDNATATFGNLTGSGQVRVDWGAAGVARTLSLNQSSNTVFVGTLGFRAGLDRTLNVVKNGSGSLTLAGTNVFTGSTTVSNGTLLVNGVLTTNATSTVLVVTNATLGGTGLINGTTVVQDGGILAPGNGGIGQLTVSNSVTLSGGSQTIMELSKSSGVPTNDLVFVSGILTQGGTLVVTNIGTNALAVGDSFQLFSAGTNTGSFTSFNLPALANGLSWTTNALATNGILAVVWSTYTLTYLAGSNGAISGTSPQNVAFNTSGAPVTAVPNSGYHFVNWSDGVTANPRTDSSVTNDISVTASFAINTYILNYAAGTNGTLSGSLTQTVNYGDSGSAVTAIANSGYAFANWSDGLTMNPRTDVNVTNNINVIANFALFAQFEPPVITRLSMAAGQTSFTLTGTGAAGHVYVLLSTTNLPPSIWAPVATNTADVNGYFQLTDTETTNYLQRFYRVQAD